MRHKRVIAASRPRRAFTIVEIIVVITVILILLAGMVKMGGVVRNSAMEKNTKTTISQLVTALEEYRDFHNGKPFVYPVLQSHFPLEPYYLKDPVNPIRLGNGLILDLVNFYDCWLLMPQYLTATFSRVDPDHLVESKNWKDWATLDTTQQTERIAARASIEVLYNYLQDVPACRKVLEKLSGSAVTNEDNDYVQRSGQDMPLLEVNDAWGHPIRYRNHGAGNFPVLTSAGPDGLFDTADDIISSEF